MVGEAGVRWFRNYFGGRWKVFEFVGIREVDGLLFIGSFF